jgi:HSP20 family protein
MFEYPRSGMFNLRVSYQNNNYRPPVDVIETSGEFLVRIEIAGVNENDFNIHMDQNVLNISGTRIDARKNFSFHQMEIHYGDFEVEVHIPQPVDRNTIKAEYKNGFLDISMNKARPTEIQIKTRMPE